jgi:hypothetical protein
MMIRLLIFVVLFEFLPGSIETHGKSIPLRQACHCATDTAIVQVWKTRYGTPDRFVASAVNRWARNILTSQFIGKTEQLILLGKSLKGVWSVESQFTDGGGELYTYLICTDVKGKRKVFPLISELSYESTSSHKKIVLRKLQQLIKIGKWDVASMIPLTLTLSSKPPVIIFREKGEQYTEKYTWSLYVKNRENRSILIRRQQADSTGLFFNEAKCFGGVIDNEGGEIWWVLIKTHQSEWCCSEWRSIRLPR